MKKIFYILTILFVFINVIFATFSSSSQSEFTLNLIHCSNYDVTYLDSYLNENTIVNYQIDNNYKKISIDFAFPIYGFVYIKTNKNTYEIKVNGSKDVSLDLKDDENLESVSYTWYNLDCNYVKQLMLLNKYQNTCKFDISEYTQLKKYISNIKNKIKKIKNNILYKTEYNKILYYYNNLVNDLDAAKIAYINKECFEYKQYLNDAKRNIKQIKNELNKNIFDLLVSLIFR